MEIPRLDLEAARIWIYPSNYPIRKYQKDLVKKSLFQNTLIS
jgi:ERCC4-related helicase